MEPTHAKSCHETELMSIEIALMVNKARENDMDSDEYLKDKTIKIFSDCKGAIQSIQKYNSKYDKAKEVLNAKSRPILENIKLEMNKLPAKVELEWMKGHDNIFGNEGSHYTNQLGLTLKPLPLMDHSDLHPLAVVVSKGEIVEGNVRTHLKKNFWNNTME